MATTTADIKATYPLPVYYYEVSIDGLDPIAFTEVSGLTIEYETITYKDGMSYKEGAKHMPGQPSGPVKFSLKKGVMRKDSKLLDWIDTVKLNTVEKKDVSITLKDESDGPVVAWKASNVFPAKLEAPSFNAGSNEVAIESMDLVADSLTIEYL